MSIDTRFLQSAKDKVQATARSGMQFARENPRLSLGSAAAMLVAPAVFSNDQRGYLQTATVTTPLISAATYTAPSIVGAFRSQFSPHVKPTVRRMADQWKATQERKSVRYEDVRQATQDYSEQSVPLNVYQDVMRRHYAGRMRKAPDLTAERMALKSHLKATLDKEEGAEGTLQYLSNAIHAEKLRTMSAADLAAYRVDLFNRPGTSRDSIAPMLGKEDILAAVEGQLGNESFVRGMNSRLQRMDGLIFLDKKVGASNALLSRYTSARWGASDLLLRQLQVEHPELYSSISDLTKKPWFNTDDLSVLTLEEEGNPIAALRYKGARGLTIPVVQKDGSVHLGESFRRVGISRKVYTADRLMSADVYAVEALKRGQSLGDIKQELQRVNIVGAVDASEDFSTLLPPDYGEYVNADGDFALRSRSAVPSHLYGFTKVDPKTGQTEVVGFEALNAESKEAAILQAVEKHGFTKVGSESGVAKGVFELLETDLLAAFGLTNREKQNPAWRSYTKNIRLTKPEYSTEFIPGSMTKVRDSLHPFFETDYMTKIAPHVDKREVGIRVGGITGGEKTLFGDLPETVGGLAAYEQSAIKLISQERSINTEEARAAWMELSHFLSDPKNLKAMRRLGTLGEGGFLMRNNLYGMGVERTVRYDVHELHMPDWESMIGSSVEESLGLKKGQKAVLGYFNGNPVVAGGTKNYIENVHDMGDGILGVEVREVVPFGTGTKIDAGIKGLVSGVGNADMRRIKEGLNKYYKATGNGGFIADEVEALQVLHYGQNKEDPLEAVLNATGDTFRRLEESGELDAVQPYMKLLEGQGLIYNEGTLTFETAALKSAKGEELRDQSLNIIQDMFADISTRIEQGRIRGDEFMQSFALSKESSYLQFVHHYADPRTMRVWNTTQWNVPQEVKVTYDMLQQLAIKGHHGAVTDILDRLKYDGDPGMTSKLERYLAGNKDAIGQSMTLDEATGGSALRQMSTPEGRAGTVFDPGSAKAAENYVLKLPDGTEVPVLGHNAYGGKVNRYGAAQFSPSEHEQALIDLMRLHQEGSPNARRAEAARDAYLGSLKKFVYGKKSYLRADATDNGMAIGAFVQTRASTLRNADGSVNPFEIGIGRDMAGRLRDEEVRNALFSEKDVYAAITRHPVSDMPFVRVRIDDTLNHTNIIGIDEGMRGLLMADDDQDMAWAFFMKKNSAGHQEAADAVAGIDVRQKRALQFQQELESIADDPRSYFSKPEAEVRKAGAAREDLNLKDLLGSLRDKRTKKWAAHLELDKALRARSTSGSIGAFSNTLTQMLIGLENNTGVTDIGKKRELMRFFFTSVRQGPISASKLKSGQDMDLSRALGINAKLQRNLEANGSFDEFYSALGELADSADAGKRSTFRNYLADNREVLKAYHAGFDREAAAQATRVLSTPADRAAGARTLGMDPDLLSYIQAASTDAKEAGETVSAGAKMSAETLGMWNRMKTAATESRAAFRETKAGLVIGAGVAIAMVAGVATTSIARRGAEPVFGRDSGSRYRPEEVAGVSDQAPGGAQEGSRAARPRRTAVPAAAQTRTAIVAPLGETADLDVRMRAPDRARAVETTKTLRRLATDGDSNITINYRNPKRASLRARERMRETLDQD
jgi:hypothetical protein